MEKGIKKICYVYFVDAKADTFNPSMCQESKCLSGREGETILLTSCWWINSSWRPSFWQGLAILLRPVLCVGLIPEGLQGVGLVSTEHGGCKSGPGVRLAQWGSCISYQDTTSGEAWPCHLWKQLHRALEQNNGLVHLRHRSCVSRVQSCNRCCCVCYDHHMKMKILCPKMEQRETVLVSLWDI